jgi:asparagine synthase (glutamine-hydrolysing)
MCGIAGIVDLAGRGPDETIVASMCRAIRHRGPDDHGLKALRSADGSASAVLGSQRLAIIDVAGGHQPISNEDGSVWTVLNGEIYNFAALRARLERSGHQFSTHSDTEVIVHLYEEMGPDFVGELDGMFALALWDRRNDRLVLARDRFGKKPLLYADRGGRLSFASEFSGVLVDADIDTTLDPHALDYYLTFMSIPAPHTIYRGIRKLPPAHRLVRDRAGVRVEPYWRLAFAPKSRLSEDEAIERFHELFRAAVKKRLISDVPLGAFLSGGIDSSAVVAFMAQTSDAPVKAFSIGFADSAYDELPHARRVAQAFGCEHHEFVVEPRAVDVLPTLVRHFGEPFADSSAIPSYYLSQLTRRHVTVALNGDGGDELFAGYGWHRANRIAERWQRLPYAARMLVRQAIERTVPATGDRRRTAARIRRFLAAAELGQADRYRGWLGIFTPRLKAELLGRPLVPSGPDLIDDAFADTAGLDPVDAMLSVDCRFYLPTDLLVKMDIASMANSLEARSPFLDHHLAEFVASLPSNYKVRGRTSKYLLKRSLEGILPPENLTRGKQGFALPISHWLRADLKDFVRDHLLSARFAQRGLFKQDVVARMVRTHQDGSADNAHHLWTLLMLELWHREFADGATLRRETA